MQHSVPLSAGVRRVAGATNPKGKQNSCSAKSSCVHLAPFNLLVDYTYYYKVHNRDQTPNWFDLTDIRLYVWLTVVTLCNVPKW